MKIINDNKNICPDVEPSGIENLDVHMNEFWQRLTACSDIPLERLEEICNAEREGRCVVLPHKPGGTVFVLSKNEIVESKITEYSIKENGISFVRLYSTDDRIADYRYKNFCKSAFLTREEAEAALKGAEHDRD